MSKDDKQVRKAILILVATFISSGGLGAIGFDKLGGGEDAKEGINLVVQAAQKAVEVANAERDRLIEENTEIRALFIECNKASLSEE